MLARGDDLPREQLPHTIGKAIRAKIRLSGWKLWKDFTGKVFLHSRLWTIARRRITLPTEVRFWTLFSACPISEWPVNKRTRIRERG